MPSTAYLLLGMDISVSPPKLLGVDVFSEDNPTSLMSTRFFPVRSVRGETYGDALDKLRGHFLKGHGTIIDGWVLPLLTYSACVSIFGQSPVPVPSGMKALKTLPSHTWVGRVVYIHHGNPSEDGVTWVSDTSALYSRARVIGISDDGLPVVSHIPTHPGEVQRGVYEVYELEHVWTLPG